MSEAPSPSTGSENANPRLSPRARLLATVGALVWVAAGSMLVLRGGDMLLARSEASVLTKVLSSAAGLGLGALKGHFVLRRAAQRNRMRLAATEAPGPLDLFTPRFILLIGLMILFGWSLRAAAASGVLPWAGVGALYLGIGAALIASAPGYVRGAIGPMRTSLDSAPPPRHRPTGLIVANLGTPDAPTAEAVKRYLREFLGDPKVVDIPKPLWKTLLELIILPRRSPRVAKAYASIWTECGSPLAVTTWGIGNALAKRLEPSGVETVIAMRYGNPSMKSAIEDLVGRGCERIILLPLFPQWSDTTTGTMQEYAAKLLARRPDGPALSVVPAYYDDPGYISAMAGRIRESVGSEPVDRYVFSFHGLPQRYVRNGDPYLDHCQRTAWALAKEMELDDKEWELVFQSRFGPEPWLQPYLDKRLEELGKEGGRVAVALPGFAADCLETLEEVAEEGRDDFLAAGGRELVVVPALNEDPAWIDALEALVRRTAGLVDETPGHPASAPTPRAAAGSG